MSSSVIYEVVPATLTLAMKVAANLREADVAEVWAAGRVTPDQAMLTSLEVSKDPQVGLADERPVCVFGVGEWSVLSLKGIPWLLATDELPSHARHFLRESKNYMREVKTRYRLLENYVDARNVQAVKWLRWLEFTMEPAKPFGPDRLPFHRFHWETS